MSNALRLPLIIGGIYALIFGAIQMIPPLAERVFGRPITDPAIESIWGATILGLSLFYFIAASDASKYRSFAWAFIFTLVLIVLNSCFYWFRGAYSASTILPLITLNIVLALWLFIAYRRSEV